MAYAPISKVGVLGDKAVRVRVPVGLQLHAAQYHRNLWYIGGMPTPIDAAIEIAQANNREFTTKRGEDGENFLTIYSDSDRLILLVGDESDPFDGQLVTLGRLSDGDDGSVQLDNSDSDEREKFLALVTNFCES